MSRSFFAPENKGASSDAANTPFLHDNEHSSEKDVRLPTTNVPESHSSSSATVAKATALAPILAYCMSSITMTVVNKVCLTHA